MSEILAPPEAPLVGGDVSIARLHGEACWHCGAVVTALRAAGRVSTRVDGGFRIWNVVACESHPDLVIA